jgi:hypothetical protein
VTCFYVPGLPLGVHTNSIAAESMYSSPLKCWSSLVGLPALPLGFSYNGASLKPPVVAFGVKPQDAGAERGTPHSYNPISAKYRLRRRTHGIWMTHNSSPQQHSQHGKRLRASPS